MIMKRPGSDSVSALRQWTSRIGASEQAHVTQEATNAITGKISKLIFYFMGGDKDIACAKVRFLLPSIYLP